MENYVSEQLLLFCGAALLGLVLGLAYDLLGAVRRRFPHLLVLCDVLFCEVNPIPVKTALELMGMCGGTLRLPLCEPSEEHRELIRKTLVRYGLLDT